MLLDVKQPTDVNMDSADVAVYENDGLLCHPYLDCFNFAVIDALGCFCCRTCEAAVQPDQLAGHIRNRHPEIKPTSLDMEKIEELKAAMHVTDVLPRLGHDRVVPPYKGLKIQEGYICKVCFKATGERDSMRNHMYADHPGQGTSGFEKGFVQRLCASPPFTVYWGVCLQPGSLDLNVFISNLRAEIDHNPKVLEKDIRAISPFLRKTCWHEHVQPFPTTFLLTLVDRPQNNDVNLPGLRKAVIAYYRECRSLLKSIDVFVQNLLCSHEPKRG